MTFLSLSATDIAAHVTGILREVRHTCPDLTGQLVPLEQRMQEPPRILVAGSPGAGVSTLANVLAGTESPADTAGAGPVLLCSADRPVPADVPPTVPVRQIAGPALQNVTLLDGSGGADEDLSVVAEVAEAVLYLVDREPSATDLVRIRGTGAGPAGTVLAVSRADEFGAGSFGSPDPVVDAQRYALALTQSAPVWSTTVAVSPLLAAAAQRIAATAGTRGPAPDLLHRLTSVTPASLGSVLLSGDIPADLVQDLHLLGTYGVLHGSRAAAGGAGGLSTWLIGQSGVDELRGLLFGDLAQAALLRRAATVLTDVRDLRFSTADPGVVTRALDKAESAPAAWRIRLFPEVARLAAAGMDTEASLVAAMVRADTMAELADVPAGAPTVEVVNGLREKLRQVNLQLTKFTLPVVEAALTAVSVVLRRAMAETETPQGDSCAVSESDSGGSLFR